MQTFELRAEAPNSPQHRTYSVGADTEAEARAYVESKELALCEFDLHPPARHVWEDPTGNHRNDAHVDLNLWDAYDPVFGAETSRHSSYGDAKRAASARLQNWLGRTDINDRGKFVATDLGPRSKARLAAHLQADPFNVVDVRAVPQAEVDAAIESLSGAARLAEIANRYGTTAPTGINPATWLRLREELRAGGYPIAAVTALLFGVPTKNRSDGTTNGAINWSSGGDTFKVAAHSNTWTPDQDANDFYNDATNEVTGTNWSAGGVTLTSLASTKDSTTDQARFDAADISVATVTISGVRYFVGYKSTGTASTSALIFLINCGADVSATAGTLAVTFDSTGAWLIDVT